MCKSYNFLISLSADSIKLNLNTTCYVLNVNLRVIENPVTFNFPLKQEPICHGIFTFVCDTIKNKKTISKVLTTILCQEVPSLFSAFQRIVELLRKIEFAV